ncbi:hypothetical protein LTR84_004744 [Exophiala bonariae]|uniref:Heterokaryon incompatibility domain-containing protein n=1 Tax=Exophiala bonariae TaxID=1690606 RepID=A0AAV9NPF0_9EURO|nr:hypothetical protein LTR84_004744 [Exophiala bonariae]
MNDEFRHERLKLPGGFMRLLQIQGNTSGSGSGSTTTTSGIGNANNKSQKDIISLRITQYAIHRLPQYVAISYTWGSALATRPIRVNGRPFHVRQNLWHLLWHLRQRGESRFLWIDALCIDQKNLEERNFHVQLMGNIYDKAVTAIVWLGLPSDDRRQARVLEFIGEMATFGQGKRGRGAIVDESDVVAKFRQQFLTEASVQRWANVLELCRGTYWTRTWIIQEFLQASNIQVLCGTASLEWSCFEDVVRMMRKVSTASQQQQFVLPMFTTQFMQTLPVRLTTRRIFHTSSTLEELISEFYDSRCAERRDKIYGILGIADDCGEKVIPPDTITHSGPRPDYSKHILEVYFEVFDYLLSPANPGNSTLQAVYLTQKSLELTETDLKSYVNYLTQQQQREAKVTAPPSPLSSLELRRLQSTTPLRPDYINIISEVLPGWTSMRDLRQRLEQVDWARYVGHDIKRKSLATRLSSSGSVSGLTPAMTFTALSSPSRRKSSFNSGLAEPASTSSPSRRKSSFNAALGEPTATLTGAGSSGATTPTGRPVRAPLPVDMIDNIVYMAEHASDTLHTLYNYSQRTEESSSSDQTPIATHMNKIPLQHIALSAHEKRAHHNAELHKPSIIIESLPGQGVDPVRVGFACTEARAGDLIAQFTGLQQTLVLRRVDTSSGVSLMVVGAARMVTHVGLAERGFHHAAKGAVARDGKAEQGELWSGCVVSSQVDSVTAGVADVVLSGDDGADKNGDELGSVNTDLSHYTIDIDPVSWWEILR